MLTPARARSTRQALLLVQDPRRLAYFVLGDSYEKKERREVEGTSTGFRAEDPAEEEEGADSWPPAEQRAGGARRRADGAGMLNTLHYVVLAGNPKVWDDEVRFRTQAGESLISVQEDQWVRGRRSMKLFKGQHGWGVAPVTSFDLDNILLPGEHLRDTALEVGRSWAEQDPAHREFYALKKDVSDLV